MNKGNMSADEYKQILIEFFKRDNYYLQRDNYENSDTKNYISLLFTTNKKDGADIRLLQYLPRIKGWILTDSSVQDNTIFISMTKKTFFNKLFSKLF